MDERADDNCLEWHEKGIEKIIGPDKDSLCIFFLSHQFKHVFWVLKRTVSLRGFL